MGQLLLKGLFITVTPLRFHPSLPSSDVTRPHRNNVAHPTKPTPSIIYTQTHANAHTRFKGPGRISHKVNMRSLCAEQSVMGFSFDDLAETNTKTRTSPLSIAVKYLQRSYTAHAVHFPLCYFIDCGHNYPLFWSTALSEFPLCWTISTEGWLSHAIPQPKGTVYFSCTLIIISKPR